MAAVPTSILEKRKPAAPQAAKNIAAAAKRPPRAPRKTKPLDQWTPEEFFDAATLKEGERMTAIRVDGDGKIRRRYIGPSDEQAAADVLAAAATMGTNACVALGAMKGRLAGAAQALIGMQAAPAEPPPATPGAEATPPAPPARKK